jgi:hypothetical protein
MIIQGSSYKSLSGDLRAQLMDAALEITLEHQNSLLIQGIRTMQHKLIIQFIFVLISFSITAPVNAQSHSLIQGWNLEGNDNGAVVDPNAIFGNASAATSISSNVTTVWVWDKNAVQWNFFAPSMTPSALLTYAASKGYGVLTAIPQGQGFWVNAKNAISINLSVPTISFGPAVGNFAYWIDQSNPSNSGPQKWGQVFTAPTSGGTILSKASFYVNAIQSTKSATYFMVQLSQWSDVLSQPVGTPLYTSGQVLFSTPNTNLPDHSDGYPPTFFTVNASIIPGQKYIFEILGDGVAGMVSASGSTDNGLFILEGGSTWHQFAPIALRSDMWFTR